MLVKLLIGWSLLALTVAIHAAGLAGMFRRVRTTVPSTLRFWPLTYLLVRIAWWLVVLHLVEIAIWGLFYWWKDCLPDIESSLYFSAVTYTTVGYGDLVLPPEWRLIGSVEGLTGILMCGLSTGFFFAFLNAILESRMNAGRD